MGLAFALAPLAYDRSTYHLYDLPKEIIFSLGVWILLAGLLIGAWLRRRTVSVPRDAVLLGLHLALAAVALSVATSPGEGVDPLRRGLALGAWWLIGSVFLGNRHGLRLALSGVALSGFLVALLGLAQHAGRDVWRDAEGGLLPFSRLAGNDGPAAAFGHVNFAAHFVALGLLALGGLALPPILARRGPARLLLAGAVAAPLALELAYLGITGTRSTWLAVPLAATVGLLLHLRSLGPGPARRRIVIGAAALVVVGAVGLLALDPLVRVRSRGGEGEVRLSERLARLVDFEQGSLHERRVLWSNTWALAARNPWLGVGPGNWKIRYPGVARAAMVHSPGTFRVDRQPEHVHQDPLQVLAETGWLGVLPLALFIGVGLLRLLRLGCRSDRRLATPAAAAAACTVAVLAISLVSFPFQKAATASVTFALLGAGAGLVRREGGPAWRLGGGGLAAGIVVVGVLGTVTALSLHARLVGGRHYVHSRALTQAATSGAQDRAASVGNGAMPLTDAQLLARALDEADRAAARQPATNRYQIQRARVLRLLGRWDQAAAVLERALTLHPGFVNALLGRAPLLQVQGRYDEALELLERARRIQPDAPEVHLARARLFHDQGMRGDLEARRRAAEAYLQAIGDRPWAPVPRLLLARLLLDVNASTDRVVALLSRAELDASRDPGLLADCARLYGDPRLGAVSPLFGPSGTKALELWRRVVDLTRGLDQEAVMHVALEPLKRYRSGAAPRPGAEPLREMKAKVQSFLALHPDDLLARYFHAVILELVDDPGGALVEWGNLARRVFGLGPGDAGLRWIIAEAAQASERLREQLEGSR